MLGGGWGGGEVQADPFPPQGRAVGHKLALLAGKDFLLLPAPCGLGLGAQRLEQGRGVIKPKGGGLFASGQGAEWGGCRPKGKRRRWKQEAAGGSSGGMRGKRLFGGD